MFFPKVCLQRKQVSTNDVCVECCHGNFCNSKGCGDKGTIVFELGQSHFKNKPFQIY